MAMPQPAPTLLHSLLRMFAYFGRTYPGQTAAVLTLTLLASAAEGIGIVTLLPLLGIATGAIEEMEKIGGGFISRAFDTVLDTVGMTASVGTLLFVIVLLVILKAGLTFESKRQLAFTVTTVETDLRLELIRSLMTARWVYFTEQPLGRLAAAMSTQANRSAAAYGTTCTLIFSILQTLMYVGLALLVSWKLTMASLAFGVAIYILLYPLVTSARHAGQRQTHVLQMLLVRLIEGLGAIKPLKAMACENRLAPLLEAETVDLRAARRKQFLSTGLLKSVQEPIASIVLGVTVYVALVHWNTPFAHLVFIAILFQRMLGRLGELQSGVQKLGVQESAFWAMREAIEKASAAREVTRGKIKPSLREAIRLDRVTFSYDSKRVLQNASFTAPVGALTVIIGPSGVGKTTIVDLIIGLLRPDKGDVWIDGTRIADVDIQQWRGQIGYVPQQVLLFNDSVIVNLTLGDPGLTRADAEAALRAADAWDFVSDLPQGLDTVIGESGAKLSGGQRQRISIARALVRQPELLILDEATANLDPRTEAEIGMTIKALTGRMMVLAVTHSQSFLDIADVVYRVENGIVVEAAARSDSAAKLPRATHA